MIPFLFVIVVFSFLLHGGWLTRSYAALLLHFRQHTADLPVLPSIALYQSIHMSSDLDPTFTDMVNDGRQRLRLGLSLGSRGTDPFLSSTAAERGAWRRCKVRCLVIVPFVLWALLGCCEQTCAGSTCAPV